MTAYIVSLDTRYAVGVWTTNNTTWAKPANRWSRVWWGISPPSGQKKLSFSQNNARCALFC